MKQFLNALFSACIVVGVACFITTTIDGHNPVAYFYAGVIFIIGIGGIGLLATQSIREPTQPANQIVWDNLSMLAEISQLHAKTRELQTQIDALAKDCVKPCLDGVCAKECDKVDICADKIETPVESEAKPKRTRKAKPTETA